MVGLALRGLELTDPTKVVGFDQAAVLGGHGGDRRSEKVREDQGDNVTLIAKRGNAASYTLARLDRDGLDDLASKVRSKELSAHAAAIEAGWRKRLTPFEQIVRHYRLFSIHLRSLETEKAQLAVAQGHRELCAIFSAVRRSGYITPRKSVAGRYRTEAPAFGDPSRRDRASVGPGPLATRGRCAAAKLRQTVAIVPASCAAPAGPTSGERFVLIGKNPTW